jgi:hypothetical protein
METLTPFFPFCSHAGSPITPELAPTKALRVEARDAVRTTRPRSGRTSRPTMVATSSSQSVVSRDIPRGEERAHTTGPGLEVGRGV